MPRTLNRRQLILVSLLTLACRPVPPRSDETTAPITPESGVTITLDRARYSQGSRVEMRVTNHTSDTVGFNPCTRSVERRQGDGWVTVPEPDRVCTMQIWLLSPHDSRAGTTELPGSLARGTYRLSLILTREKTAQSGGAPPTPAPTIQAVSTLFEVE
jgi:hypothetical protein